ncbi:MAG TPA: phosphopantetheine-binding protein [Trebonia sp.]|nr:phosphopantetheine-binding protein [Trebonia sp.]
MSATEGPGQPPRSALEAAVLGLWRFVLRMEVGVDDDFLASGGDSLSGMILLAAIDDVFGEQLTLEELFDRGPTPAKMAALLAIPNAPYG